MIKERILAATGKIPPDIVITDIGVVDVFSQEIYRADVAIHKGYFVGIGDYHGKGALEIDGTDRYILPGFIDAHAHIESTLVTPIEYSNVSLPHGITGVVADPHEIANVCGIAGIEYIIESAQHVPMDIYVMLPSCVPATSFENSGAALPAKELKPLYGREGILGLGEVMDCQAVLTGDPDMMQKIEDAAEAGRRVDGHGAGFTVEQLNGYAAAGIHTDHECDSPAGLIDRVRRGIYTLVREGTVCRDLKRLLPAINERNSRRLCFATDDKHLDDLQAAGGIDACVRLAIGAGLNPATAAQMASLNVAHCYHLKNVGAVAPGYRADFSIVCDLEALIIDEVYKSGKAVARDGKILDRIAPDSYPPPEELIASIKIPAISEEDLVIEMQDCTSANVIGVVEGTVVTDHLVQEVRVEKGRFRTSVRRDQLKIAVIERHRKLGNIATAIIHGFRLRRGAIATTIAHDSHNLIVMGVDDAQMLTAISAIEKMQGGIVVVDNGRVLASLRLEVAGLLTTRDAHGVTLELADLERAISTLAPDCPFNPFLALSFMSLVVIPHLKISDSGLFDYSSRSFIEVPANSP